VKYTRPVAHILVAEHPKGNLLMFDPRETGLGWMIAGGTVFGGLPAGLTTGAVAFMHGSVVEGVLALFVGWLWGIIFSLIPAIAGAAVLQVWAESRGPVSELTVLALGGALGFVVVFFVLGGSSMIMSMGTVGGVSGALGAMKAKDWFGASR